MCTSSDMDCRMNQFYKKHDYLFCGNKRSQKVVVIKDSIRQMPYLQ